MGKILFLGDVVGKVGRRALAASLPALKESYSPALIIANGENAAGGLGIDPGTASELYSAGVDFITTGNHVWKKKEIHLFLDRNAGRIIRPYNYPEGTVGKGCAVVEAHDGTRVGVLNLMGRVFTGELVDCPFRAAEQALALPEFESAEVIVVDIHAEATSEKVAMGFHLDGRAGLIVGTHTHVQTADERMLPNGSAYITDLGMCGPYNSVIGVKSEIIVERFRTGMPMKFDLAKGPAIVCGVVLTFDDATKKSQAIERISIILE